MKLLKRSMIATATLVGLLAAAATPVAAIVGGQDATQTYPGMAFRSMLHHMRHAGVGKHSTLVHVASAHAFRGETEAVAVLAIAILGRFAGVYLGARLGRLANWMDARRRGRSVSST
jgi:hypothetical protein